MRSFFQLLIQIPIYFTSITLCASLPNTQVKEPGLDIFCDFLYWHATQNVPWSQTFSPSTSDPSFVQFNSLSYGWDPGFRAGIGYTMEHGGWDTQIYYTWFRTSSFDYLSVTTEDLVSIFSGASLSVTDLYKSGSVNWNILFNMFDWNLGCLFSLKNNLTLRPFMGAKGGWIHQTIKTQWDNPDLPILHVNLTAKEHLENNFWGVGPKAGLNGKWNFLVRRNHSIGLIGDIQAAFLWGHWSFKDFFSNSLKEIIPSYYKPKLMGDIVFDFLMGLNWDITFRQNKSHFSAKLGYEFQDWINQYQLFEVADGSNQKSLYLQGVSLDLLLGF